jgi:hypothetical protein
MKLFNTFLLLVAAALLSLSFADLTANDVLEGGTDMELKEVTRHLMMVSVYQLAVGTTKISRKMSLESPDVQPWLSHLKQIILSASHRARAKAREKDITMTTTPTMTTTMITL